MARAATSASFPSRRRAAARWVCSSGGETRTQVRHAGDAQRVSCCSCYGPTRYAGLPWRRSRSRQPERDAMPASEVPETERASFHVKRQRCPGRLGLHDLSEAPRVRAACGQQEPEQGPGVQPMAARRGTCCCATDEARRACPRAVRRGTSEGHGPTGSRPRRRPSLATPGLSEATRSTVALRAGVGLRHRCHRASSTGSVLQARASLQPMAARRRAPLQGLAHPGGVRGPPGIEVLLCARRATRRSAAVRLRPELSASHLVRSYIPWRPTPGLWSIRAGSQGAEGFRTGATRTPQFGAGWRRCRHERIPARPVVRTMRLPVSRGTAPAAEAGAETTRGHGARPGEPRGSASRAVRPVQCRAALRHTGRPRSRPALRPGQWGPGATARRQGGHGPNRGQHALTARPRIDGMARPAGGSEVVLVCRGEIGAKRTDAHPSSCRHRCST